MTAGWWEVNVWWTGQDLDEINDNAACVRRAAGYPESSTGMTIGPPMVRDMQFRAADQQHALDMLDRVLLSCSWVKGEVRWVPEV